MSSNPSKAVRVVVTLKSGIQTSDATYNESTGWNLVAGTTEDLHQWNSGEITKEATCTSEGERTYTCTLCGETKKEIIAAPGHTPGAEATCLAAQICTVCNAELAPALGHNYTSKITIEPTCGAKGVRTYTCQNCGASYTEAIAATGAHAWNEGVITIQPTTTTYGERTYTCTVCSHTKTEMIEKLENVSYLVDQVEIGDYVDLGDDLDYTNQEYFSEGNTIATSEEELTGWRVLSKRGSGAEGTVTLVSAGTPLVYNYDNDVFGNTAEAEAKAKKTLTSLADLSEIEITTSGTGFNANGFTGATIDSNNKVNIGNLIKNNNRIDDLAGIHALTTDELIVAYNALTGTEITLQDLYKMTTENLHACITSNMLIENPSMSAKANDLLGIGMEYWLGGKITEFAELYVLDSYGDLYCEFLYSTGVRPVVTLNPGVQIDSSNTGDGSSVGNAYTLGVYE